MSKKILIRVDASKVIGSGHVMRCLALANEAKKKGWKVCFLMRDPTENFIKLINCSGHDIQLLQSKNYIITCMANHLNYQSWLAVTQEQDANETLRVVIEYEPDWIVVDHYAIDARWLCIVNQSSSKIIMIDDLGNRDLICDILLDQNLGASREKYHGRIPVNCRLLLGPRFALLREEFKDWRERSLFNRLERNIENILVTMGGVDEEDYTLRILKQLTKSKYAKVCVFDVIIGGSYPYKSTLIDFLETTVLTASVLVDVSNMAEIMSGSDLCIGAGGSTAWERCCLGLPSITLAIADNQVQILSELEAKGLTIASNLEKIHSDFDKLLSHDQSFQLKQLSINSSTVCDGMGVHRVLNYLE